MTMFSFHPVKPITTAEGGVITTDSEEYYEKLKLFRSHGISKTPYAVEQGDWYYEMTELGFNYRMTDIQAALGLSQIKKIDKFINIRREIADIYQEALDQFPGVILPKQLDGTNSGWHLYIIQLDQAVLNKTRKEIFNEMRTCNIGVHVHYIPVYWHPYYEQLGFSKGICNVAESWYEGALTLPIFPSMEKSDVNNVIEILKSTLNK